MMINSTQNPELQQAMDRVSRAALRLEALFQTKSEEQGLSKVDRSRFNDASITAREILELLQGGKGRSEGNVGGVRIEG